MIRRKIWCKYYVQSGTESIHCSALKALLYTNLSRIPPGILLLFFFFPFFLSLTFSSHKHKATEALKPDKASTVIFTMLFCTCNRLATWVYSASARLWYGQPPCNCSATTGYFQGSKEAWWQPCYHYFRNHSQLLTNILRCAMIPFEICFGNKNSISRGRVCSCCWSSSAKFSNSLLVGISWSKYEIRWAYKWWWLEEILNIFSLRTDADMQFWSLILSFYTTDPRPLGKGI